MFNHFSFAYTFFEKLFKNLSFSELSFVSMMEVESFEEFLKVILDFRSHQEYFEDEGVE